MRFVILSYGCLTRLVLASFWLGVIVCNPLWRCDLLSHCVGLAMQQQSDLCSRLMNRAWLKRINLVLAALVIIGVASSIFHTSQHLDSNSSHASECQLCVAINKVTNAVNPVLPSVVLELLACSLCFSVLCYAAAPVSRRNEFFDSSLDPPVWA